MIDVLLLDVDGVVITGDYFSDVLERDLGLTLVDTKDFFGGPFLECLVGKADLKQEIAHYLPQWGWNKSVDEFLNYWFTSHSKINNELIAAVQQLREDGIHCYLATNQEQYRSAYIWEDLGLKDKFDGKFASHSVGYVKKQPEFFEHVVETLKIHPSAILFFDDSSIEVASAKGVGLAAEQYVSFDQLQKDLIAYGL